MTTPQSTPVDAARAKAIRAIKTKQRQLGMDDATYRQMLYARTGHNSATECNLRQLCLVSAYLSSQGAVAPNGRNGAGKKRPTVVAEKRPLMLKVLALLGQLHQLDRKNAYTIAYADAICARNGWCTRTDFADAHILHKLVGALSRTVAHRTKQANQAASNA